MFVKQLLYKTGKGVLFSSIRQIDGGRNIAIGDYSAFERNTRLSTWNDGKLNIGNNCHFGDNLFITASNSIVIGNNILTGNNVLISDNSHGRCVPSEMDIAPIDREVYSKGPITIGDNVWIGQNVCILANVKIGDGAVIGANSVVTHDVPPYCIAAGSPAKTIKHIK